MGSSITADCLICLFVSKNKINRTVSFFNHLTCFQCESEWRWSHHFESLRGHLFIYEVGGRLARAHEKGHPSSLLLTRKLQFCLWAHQHQWAAPSHAKSQEKYHIKVRFQDNRVGFRTLTSHPEERSPSLSHLTGMLEIPGNLDPLICFQEEKEILQNKAVPMTSIELFWARS